MGIRQRIFIVLGAFWLLAGVFLPAQARAQDILPGCDPEYMDALEARSWLFAQRRISMNQSLIYKPDSVLEYSCFNQYIGYLAANPDGRRFSENHPVYPNWGPIGGIDDTSLDYALFEVVTGPLLVYLSCNFPHTFLGGRAANPGGAAPAYGVYDCAAMQYVWEAARCNNFVENPDIDDFYDFPWYADNDPRQLPIEFPACEPPTDPIRAAMVESYSAEGLESGDEWEHFVLADENNPYMDDVPYEEDPMLIDDILLKVLPGPCDESAVINTGVRIQIPRQSDFDEHICTIPSCSYDGGDCVK